MKILKKQDSADRLSLRFMVVAAFFKENFQCAVFVFRKLS